MQPGAVYIVRFWVEPGSLQTVLDWLDHGHIAEVVDEPGFLWAKRVRLLNDDPDDGWPGFAMIYGIETREHLDRYFAGEAPKRFAAERAEKGLDDALRIERDWGVVEFAADA